LTRADHFQLAGCQPRSVGVDGDELARIGEHGGLYAFEGFPGVPRRIHEFDFPLVREGEMPSGGIGGNRGFGVEVP
jgi:hypothetical protein